MKRRSKMSNKLKSNKPKESIYRTAIVSATQSHTIAYKFYKEKILQPQHTEQKLFSKKK